MEEQELTAELAAMHVLTKLCREEVEGRGKGRVGREGKVAYSPLQRASHTSTPQQPV